MSFVFYDTETTGTDTTFGQILQFAAVYTDDEFNELDRIEMRCRLMPHVVPAPGAMRVTRVPAAALSHAELPSHYQMISAIRQKLVEWSPAIFIGYNSLEFDEPLLRQAFYQSLYPIYLTNTNGNRRTDALKIVQAASLFAPGVLDIPTGDRGQAVFKLERCAPANGFNHENAHDALADVFATIHLCRLVAERAPELWRSLLQFSAKAAASAFVQESEVFCLAEFFFGKASPLMVTSIGTGSDSGSGPFVYDLSVDPERLAQEPEDKLVARLNRSPKVVRRVRTNASPILMPPDAAPADLKALKLGIEELTRRAQYLKADPQLRGRLIGAVEASWEEKEPSPHVEEQIHDGFPSSADEKRLRRFHTVPWEERPAILRELEDERLRLLAHRLIYMEAPHVLGAEWRDRMELEIAKRLLGTAQEPKWLTLPGAIEEADQLIAEAASEEEARLLSEHREFLVLRQEAAQARVAGQRRQTED